MAALQPAVRLPFRHKETEEQKAKGKGTCPLGPLLIYSEKCLIVVKYTRGKMYHLNHF